MKMTMISTAAALAIVGTVMFTGCGGSDSSGISSSGTATKGRLNNARIQADFNKDGNFSSDEIAYTDSVGKFSFRHGLFEGQAIRVELHGGRDTGDDKDFGGVMFGYMDNTNVMNLSPLSTVTALTYDAILEDNASASLDDTKEIVAAKMGLNAEDLNKDPIAAAKDKPEVFKKSLTIGKQVELMAGGDANEYKKVVKSIAAIIKENKDNNTSTIENAVDPVAIKLKDSTIKTTVTTAQVQAISTVIDKADINTSKSTEDLEKDIKSIEKASTVVVTLVKNNTVTGVENLDINKLKEEIDQLEAQRETENNDSIIIDPEKIASDIEATIGIGGAIDSNTTFDVDYNSTKEVVEEYTQDEADEAIDRLVIKDSVISYGDKNVTITNGKLSTLTIEANSSALQNVSLTLTDDTVTETYPGDDIHDPYDYGVSAPEMLEVGDEKTLLLTLNVKSDTDSRELTATVQDAVIKKTGDYYSNADSNYTQEAAYTLNTDSSKLKVLSGNKSAEVDLESNIITISNNTITLNTNNLLNSLAGTAVDTVKSQFDQDGNYTITLTVDGVDGVSGFDANGKATGKLIVGAGATASDDDTTTGEDDNTTTGEDDNTTTGEDDNTTTPTTYDTTIETTDGSVNGVALASAGSETLAFDKVDGLTGNATTFYISVNGGDAEAGVTTSDDMTGAFVYTNAAGTSYIGDFATAISAGTIDLTEEAN